VVGSLILFLAVYLKIPLDKLYEANYDRFAQLAENAAVRTQVLEEVGIKNLINGPIPVSVEEEPIMGKCPEERNVYVAAGFTAGIGQSCGVGLLLSEWILD
jgi:sarcosine dehydrogenase